MISGLCNVGEIDVSICSTIKRPRSNPDLDRDRVPSSDFCASLQQPDGQQSFHKRVRLKMSHVYDGGGGGFCAGGGGGFNALGGGGLAAAGGGGLASSGGGGLIPGGGAEPCRG